jgi:K+-sensing histidine kinase KdpD
MRIAPSIDDDAVVLKVETSGVGIPTKKAERIFDEILAGPQGTQRLVSS